MVTDSDEVANMASPALRLAGVCGAPSMLNVTVPVGVPAPGDTASTLAVNVTLLPNVEGFNDELTAVLLLAGSTVWKKSMEVLKLKLSSPLYVALIVWLPTLNDAFVNVACPDALMLTGVCGVPSRLNVTLPVSVPAPGATGATVAVNTTDCPNTDGFAEEARVVVVSALLTVCVKSVEVLPVRLASPLYVAVMLGWLPTDNDAVMKFACPLASVPVPSVVAPSSKVTVPVGVLTPDTVAVNVTGSPNTDGLGEDVMSVALLALLTVCVKSVEVLAS